MLEYCVISMFSQKSIRYTLAVLSGFTAFVILSVAISTNIRIPFLSQEATVLLSQREIPVDKPKFGYIEIINSCNESFENDCVVARSGPSTEFPTVATLRSGIVLKVEKSVVENDQLWHKVIFDEWLRYPNRVRGDWYVSSEYSRFFLDNGTHDLTQSDSIPKAKYILVDRSDQTLYAYEDDILVMSQVISTGIDLTPTPRGTFTIYRKTPSRYMQGPLPGISSKYYDLPGVPWNLYFTKQGGVIHGAYWHNSFGKKWSSGCVNVPLTKAQELYEWADIGTKVIVRD